MLEDYKRECGASHIKTGIALKGDYSFNELQKMVGNVRGLSGFKRLKSVPFPAR